MTPDTLTRLKKLQEQAIEHAFEEMDAAHALSLNTKEERGDRAWLTGMCAKSLGVAYRVEQFIAMREVRDAGFDRREIEEQERAEAEFVKRAEAQMRAILERASVKPRHAAKG